MSTIGIIFISLAVIAVTAVLFVGWVIYRIISAIAQSVYPARKGRRLVTAIRQRIHRRPGMKSCSRENCQNLNPPEARFCKCCGAALQSAATTSRKLSPRPPLKMSA